MHVLMTIDAIAANIQETPPIIFLVTGKARSSHVGTVQLKVTQIMLFYGIIGELKSINGMTIFAIGGRIGPGKVAFVVIGMTVVAPVMWQRSGIIIFVTLLTSDLRVESPQRESGFVVVEIGHAFDLCPRLFAVALGTVLPEFIVMDIFVATGAVGMWHVGKMLERLAINRFLFVAIDARYFGVFSFQGKVGLVMMEVRYCFETFEIVTLGTIVRQGLPVVVRVTREALLRKPEVRQFFVFQFLIGDKFLFVAGLAVGSFVRSLKLKTGQVVIEGGLIEVEHVEIAAMVLVVAG